MIYFHFDVLLIFIEYLDAVGLVVRVLPLYHPFVLLCLLNGYALNRLSLKTDPVISRINTVF